MLKAKAERGTLEEGDFVARTVVTTRLISDIAAEFDVPVAETLTGFKWIAAEIAAREGHGRFLVGGEESYGYLIGDEVRDKDAIAAACMIAELADVEWRQGRTLLDRLRDLHRHHGMYREALVSLKRDGIAGAAEIRAMMDGFRTTPPSHLGGEAVAEVRDHLEGWKGLPPSNVIQFLTEEGALVTASPSGTEPKIKFYFSVKESGPPRRPMPRHGIHLATALPASARTSASRYSLMTPTDRCPFRSREIHVVGR